MTKMLGRLGWRGQCPYCDGPKEKRAIKREEERQWRGELEPSVQDYVVFVCATCNCIHTSCTASGLAEMLRKHAGHDYQRFNGGETDEIFNAIEVTNGQA